MTLFDSLRLLAQHEGAEVIEPLIPLSIHVHHAASTELTFDAVQVILARRGQIAAFVCLLLRYFVLQEFVVSLVHAFREIRCNLRRRCDAIWIASWQMDAAEQHLNSPSVRHTLV